MQNFQSSLEGGCLSAFMGFARYGWDTLGNAVSIANHMETHANTPAKPRK